MVTEWTKSNRTHLYKRTYICTKGYDGADGKPLNPFANESFAHAVARLGKSKKRKRKVAKGGALSFEKRKKATTALESVVN